MPGPEGALPGLARPRWARLPTADLRPAPLACPGRRLSVSKAASVLQRDGHCGCPHPQPSNFPATVRSLLSSLPRPSLLQLGLRCQVSSWTGTRLEEVCVTRPDYLDTCTSVMPNEDTILCPAPGSGLSALRPATEQLHGVHVVAGASLRLGAGPLAHSW